MFKLRTKILQIDDNLEIYKGGTKLQYCYIYSYKNKIKQVKC